MSLIKCKECGTEVSSKAETCPKCGARVARKPIGCGTVIGIIFLLGIIISVFPNLFSSGTGNGTSPSPSAKSPKEEALAALEIKKLDWNTGGFDTIMMVNVIFQNNGKRDVKDIELECVHFAKSGTRIDSNKKVIYEVVPAGKSLTVKQFNMGFIHSQVASTSCKITDVVVM